MSKGPLPYGNKNRVRMRDVAERCGVSISTVSLVLSSDPRIPEDTTRKVLETVKAMEYRPSVIARSLARRVSRTIGVILPEFAFSKNQPFYYQALQGIHDQTQPAGYKMVVEAANKVFIERKFYLRLLKEQSTDGVIFLAASLTDEFLRDMEKEAYPFILVGSTLEGLNLPCARGDDALGAKRATEHLIALGHKAIGHVAGLSNVSYCHDREAGYRQAMEEAHLSVDPSWVVNGDLDPKEAQAATSQLLAAKVTAIFAGGDVMAYGVLRALKEAGRRVPEDVAVVGMDDLDMSAWIDPPLSTVRYDIAAMAGLAAKYVLRQIQSPLMTRNALGEMPPVELVVRASCGGKK
ncbi:MAG: LacI family transcriptional regulator [Elusimicrobia bacterium]|nr:LacI family transcriptional regulator [Candidatus Obscuribacterium magneticum]